MTDARYRIDPNFVAPEPSAATHFCYWTLDDYSDEKRIEVIDGWREKGVKQLRITIINDEYPHEPYPHGYWLEGWTDERARQLPFGEAETADGPIWPPLTYGNGKLATEVISHD
jgi:hypothetical protein